MTGVEAQAGVRPPHILTLTMLSGLASATMNLFLPSLPGMARDLGVDYAVMQIAVTGYLAVSAAVQLVIGPLSDRFGRRPVMLTSLVLFLVATLGTVLATNAALFLACRLGQSVIAAGMVIPRAVVRDQTAGAGAASRLGYVTMGQALLQMGAPVIGGALDDAFGWRANFVVLGLAALAALGWTWRDLRETGRPGGLGMAEQLRGYPVLLRSARFWGYCLAATFGSGAFFAYLGGAPFVGGTVFHMSAAQVGYWFMAPSIGYLTGNFLTARYSARFGMDRMIAAGGAFLTAGPVAALAVDLAGGTTPLTFFGAVAFVGLGNGMMLPNANVGMMSVRADLAGTAAGLGSALMVAGGAALAALAATQLTPGAGATPLLAIMAVSAAASLLALLLVRR